MLVNFSFQWPLPGLYEINPLPTDPLSWTWHFCVFRSSLMDDAMEFVLSINHQREESCTGRNFGEGDAVVLWLEWHHFAVMMSVFFFYKMPHKQGTFAFFSDCSVGRCYLCFLSSTRWNFDTNGRDADSSLWIVRPRERRRWLKTSLSKLFLSHKLSENVQIRGIVCGN